MAAMEQEPGTCPRVNFALMERYVGRNVLLVCKVRASTPSLFGKHHRLLLHLLDIQRLSSRI